MGGLEREIERERRCLRPIIRQKKWKNEWKSLWGCNRKMAGFELGLWVFMGGRVEERRGRDRSGWDEWWKKDKIDGIPLPFPSFSYSLFLFSFIFIYIDFSAEIGGPNGEGTLGPGNSFKWNRTSTSRPFHFHCLFDCIQSDRVSNYSQLKRRLLFRLVNR